MVKIRNIYLTILFLSVIFSVQISNATDSSSSKPVGQPLYCYGCSGLLSELHKNLKSSYGRISVIKTELGNICQTNNFVVYKFSPPKMLKACQYILENYETQLLEALSKYYKKYNTVNNQLLKEEFCISTIKACSLLPNGEELMHIEANEEL